MRLKVAAAGNAEKNINPIDGRFQAEALRFLRGFDVGILHNTFYSDADPTGEMRDDNPSFNWKIEGKTVDDITVGPGMATAYGYDILNEETIHLKADRSNPNGMFYIYLEWNLSNPDEAVGKIDIHYGPDSPEGVAWFRKDNLCINPNGIFRMILAKVGFNEDGTITTITEGSFGNYDGYQPLYAINSGHAVYSEYAQYAEGYSDKTLAAHLQAINDRLEKLGRREGEVQLSYGTASTNKLIKEGNYCHMRLDVTIPYFTTSYGTKKEIGTIPEGFRGSIGDFLIASFDRHGYWEVEGGRNYVLYLLSIDSTTGKITLEFIGGQGVGQGDDYPIKIYAWWQV